MKLTEGQVWYHGYLASRQWEMTKRRILKKRLYVCQITKCYKRTKLQFHHLTYDNLGYEDEQDIVIVCRTHHYLCHYKWLGIKKVPLTQKELFKRYNYLSLHIWRRLRPSHLFNWLYQSYSI